MTLFSPVYNKVSLAGRYLRSHPLEAGTCTLKIIGKFP